MRKMLPALAMLLALAFPAGGLPIDVAMKVPDNGLLAQFVPTVVSGNVAVTNEGLRVATVDKEVFVLTGEVKVQVNWSLYLAYGSSSYRSFSLYAYVLDNDVPVAQEQVYRQYQSTNYINEAGALTMLVRTVGTEVRHELIVRIYASYYSSSPYASLWREGGSVVVATGSPKMIGSAVQTAPRMQVASLLSEDVRDAGFQPGLRTALAFNDTTLVTPDRLAVLKVPYRFLRQTAALGWGYEYMYVQAYAYDQDGRYLGGASSGAYRDRQCCGALAIDEQGTLDLVAEVRDSPTARHDIIVQVYAYWQGYACRNDGSGCSWFYENTSKSGSGGVLYTLPDRAPTTDEVANAVLHAV